MQSSPEILPNPKSGHWLNVAEMVATVGSAVGTVVVSLFYMKQLAIVSLPLSVSVALNLANRRRLVDLVEQRVQTTVAEQVSELQNRATSLQRQFGQLQDRTQNLDSRHQQTAEVAKCLRAIKNYSQEIQTNSKCTAETYYLRGVSHHRLGDVREAVEDYTEAIRIDSSFAKAYFNRGRGSAQLGDKQSAVEDLRTAAKFFFEQGDLDNYRKARDLSKDSHNNLESIEPKPEIVEEEEELVVEELFV
jgi:tetratricopeptide (TPR) repeat protein